jgi:hypothetical protein
MMDIVEIVHFASFGPIVYLTLKRDCQYWSNDAVDADEESALLITETAQVMRFLFLQSYLVLKI